MKNDESNIWLKKLINADYFDTWLAVSYLYRYSSLGIHEYICKKLRYSNNIMIVLPQLVHVFLYYSDSDVSMPIYDLFKFWSSKSKKFCCSLYFYLKASINNSEEKKSIQCYFLICDIFQNDRYIQNRNTKMLQIQYKHGRKLSITRGLCKDKKGIQSFDGIFLTFLKSVSWFLDSGLFKKVQSYEDKLITTKNATNINFCIDLSSGFAFRSESVKTSIIFIETLIDISNRLKKLPKKLRQKGLEMELKLINCNLPAKITLPFSNSKYVLSARIEYSYVLDSAENTPFLIVFEVADETTPRQTYMNDELKNASFLMQQLNTVTGLTYLTDINNIKENVISSLEKILNTERAAENARALEKPAKHSNNNRYTKIQRRSKSLHNFGRKNREILDSKEAFNYQDLLNYGEIDDTSSKTDDSKTFSNSFTEMFFDVDPSDESEKVEIDNVEKEDEVDSNEDESLYELKTLMDLYRNEWKCKENRVRDVSKYSHLKKWNLASLIVKSGSSLKQEIIAYQILNEMKNIWKDEKKDIWIRTYEIYFVDNTSGLIETVTNAFSIHKIKEMGQEKEKNFSLKNYFIEKYGFQTEEYKKATLNFLRSLVGYSLASYILQIKDRHNGNILLDSEGHVVHVDFGFILGDHPGFYCVEIAPFKFSKEYLDLLDDLMEEFKMLFLEGFIALRKHSERLCRIIEILSENSDVRCLNKRVLYNFRDRLKLEMSDKEVEIYVMWLINKSLNSVTTGLYDSYQYFSNGYL